MDLAERLKSAPADELVAVFDGRRKLTVRASDLSYYNWDTGVCLNTHSSNFQVKVEDDESPAAAASAAVSLPEEEGGGRRSGAVDGRNATGAAARRRSALQEQEGQEGRVGRP